MHLLGFREVVNTSLLILCFVACTFLSFDGGGTAEVYKVKKVILPISYKYDNKKSDLVKENQIIVN